MTGNHLLYQLQTITNDFHFHSFYATKYFSKIIEEKLLIEQNIEFELREHVPPGHRDYPKTWYFHDKIKISQANLQVNCNLQVKILQGALYLASLKIFQEAMYLTKSNLKCMILNRVLDLICK